jgi:type I restriction enzyme, S subunit
MNAERLLAHYEQIADAPDAMARLRRFILDLAVRGKLVPQDPSDEPAAELLKRIEKEKAHLVKAEEIKRDKPSIATSDCEIAFDLPTGWVATFLADVAVCLDYRRVPINSTEREARIAGKAQEDLFPYFGATQQQGWIDEYLFDGEFVLLGEDGVPFYDALRTKAYLITGKSWVNNHAHVFQGILTLPRFLVHYLNVFDYAGRVVGATRAKLNQAQAVTIPIPLPPLAEQHRIVAKVEELMDLCDQLEAARGSREATRDRLGAACRARLNAPDLETFQADARFALDALPALTTRTDQIKQLRQTILNLAVRGKLVPQDPNDEPASELLERIGKEKKRLVKAGRIRREQPLPPLSEVNKSFDSPDGWTWIRLGDLSQLVTSGSRDWAKHYSDKGAIFVRMGNLSKDHYRLRLDHIQRVSPPSDGEGTRTRLEAGDILISITGDVGMLGLIPEGFGEAYINQHTAMVRPMSEMRGRYLAELFRSPFAQGQFNEPQRGIKNSFRLTDITQFVVPLPPLAEQHRIVAKVDELMALCDRLEASLTATAATRRRLLDALLAEALAPAEDRELEAAE